MCFWVHTLQCQSLVASPRSDRTDFLPSPTEGPAGVLPRRSPFIHPGQQQSFSVQATAGSRRRLGVKPRAVPASPPVAPSQTCTFSRPGSASCTPILSDPGPGTTASIRRAVWPPVPHEVKTSLLPAYLPPVSKVSLPENPGYPLNSGFQPVDFPRESIFGKARIYFWLSQLGELLCIQWVEDRGADKHPTMHATAPINSSSSPKCQ